MKLSTFGRSTLALLIALNGIPVLTAPNTAPRNERIVQLWSDPLAMVKAATAAGNQTQVAAEAGRTIVTFPVPGVSGATVKATLNARHQAEQVDAQFGTTPIHTTYSDYVELNGS